MTYSRLLLLAALLPVLTVACNRSDATSGLPPAEGPGAPALPAPPHLDAVEAESTAVADQVLRATGSTAAIKQAELGPKASGVLAAVLGRGRGSHQERAAALPSRRDQSDARRQTGRSRIGASKSESEPS